jgi:hypothetical protein
VLIDHVAQIPDLTDSGWGIVACDIGIYVTAPGAHYPGALLYGLTYGALDFLESAFVVVATT